MARRNKKQKKPALTGAASPDIQRANRRHVIEGRAAVLAETGKRPNPNGANGIRFIGTVEAALKAGKITQDMLATAEEFEWLCREVYGSPSQRSCMDFAPTGNGEEHSPNPQALARFRQACDRLSMFERGEAIRVCWEGHPIARIDMFKAAMDKLQDA